MIFLRRADPGWPARGNPLAGGTGAAGSGRGALFVMVAVAGLPGLRVSGGMDFAVVLRGDQSDARRLPLPLQESPRLGRFPEGFDAAVVSDHELWDVCRQRVQPAILCRRQIGGADLGASWFLSRSWVPAIYMLESSRFERLIPGR